MQDDMVNCGNPYEDGDAVLDASTIKEYAPITGELRSYMRRAVSTNDTCWWTATDTQAVYQLCDAIDSVHAQLEGDCADSDRQVAELQSQNEKLRKKLTNAREQLTNVQKALEDRNKGVLKQRWQKKCDALNGEIESLKKEVLSLKEQLTVAKDEDQGHAYAPESHYMMLPKDADAKPIHLGDVMEWEDGDTAVVVGIGRDTFFYVEGINDCAEWTRASDKRHHVDDSFERVILDAASRDVGTMSRVECNEFVKGLVARCKRLAGQS